MNDSIDIPIVLSDGAARIPSYTRPGDAAVDLRSTCAVSLEPFERALIPTGVHIALPKHYAGLVLPRSGLAFRQGLSLVNSPGLIDSNYRGEIQVIAVNLDPKETIQLKAQERIAQLLVIKAGDIRFIESSFLDETERGTNGFGSSGQS